MTRRRFFTTTMPAGRLAEFSALRVSVRFGTDFDDGCGTAFGSGGCEVPRSPERTRTHAWAVDAFRFRHLPGVITVKTDALRAGAQGG